MGRRDPGHLWTLTIVPTEKSIAGSWSMEGLTTWRASESVLFQAITVAGIFEAGRILAGNRALSPSRRPAALI